MKKEYFLDNTPEKKQKKHKLLKAIKKGVGLVLLAFAATYVASCKSCTSCQQFEFKSCNIFESKEKRDEREKEEAEKKLEEEREQTQKKLKKDLKEFGTSLSNNFTRITPKETVKVDGNTYSYERDGKIYYVVSENGKNYQIAQDESGNWIKQEHFGVRNVEEFVNESKEFLTIPFMWKYDYDYETNYAYYSIPSSGCFFSEIFLKKTGALYFYYEKNDNDIKFNFIRFGATDLSTMKKEILEQQTVEFVDVGKTSIELPENIIEVAPKENRTTYTKISEGQFDFNYPVLKETIEDWWHFYEGEGKINKLDQILFVNPLILENTLYGFNIGYFGEKEYPNGLTDKKELAYGFGIKKIYSNDKIFDGDVSENDLYSLLCKDNVVISNDSIIRGKLDTEVFTPEEEETLKNNIYKKITIPDEKQIENNKSWTL